MRPPAPPPASRRCRPLCHALLALAAGTALVCCGPQRAAPAGGEPPAAAAAPIAAAGRPCTPPPPNLVMVVSDTLRAANLGLHGYPRQTAPNLEALARESLVFRRHLANYSATPFSVSQMHTGRLIPPLLMDWSPGQPPVWEPGEDLLVLPGALGAAGYRTALFSTHPWFNERSRLLSAFQEARVLRFADQWVYPPFAAVYLHVDRFLRAAAAESRPFFLYLHTMDTHKPFHHHPDMGPFGDEADWPDVINRYDAEIRYTDAWVGKVVELLRREEVLDDTIFVFTSDHGEDFGELGEGWWNREHGATTHRSLLHVPLVVRLPARCRAVGVWDPMTRHVDLAPTLLGLAVGGLPPGVTVDGSDLSAAILRGDGYGGPPSIAFSHRFWSLSEGDDELVYDSWEGSAELRRWRPDPTNYPRPAELGEPHRRSELGRELVRRYRDGQRALASMPRNRGPLEPLELGISSWIHPASPTLPTYAESAADGLWQLIPGYLLKLEAGESAAALRLLWPAVPGTYRVWIRLQGNDGGYRNRLTVRFTGEPETVAVDGRDASREGLVDLGLHRVANLLSLEIGDAAGGVFITGLLLDPAAGDVPARVIDEETEAQLRALGYLH